MLKMFANVPLLLVTLSYACYSYFQYLFTYWMGYYFNDVMKLTEAESRNAAFTVTISMAAGMAVGGFATDLLSRRFGFRIGCRIVAMTGMTAGAIFTVVGIQSGANLLILLFSMALFSLGMCEGVFWTTAASLERRRGGLACAFLNTGGNAGGLLAPIFTPYIARLTNWPTAIGVACVICGVGALIWMLIDAERQSSEPVVAGDDYPAVGSQTAAQPG
jgi:MFS family permease